MRQLSVALVHYPVLTRGGEVVTTAITNLDLHDIARSTYTYGVERYFIVHPISAQQELARRVKTHWTEGSGARRIPDRAPPMGCLEVVSSIEEAKSALGSEVEVWVTSAQPGKADTSHKAAAALLRAAGPPVLLLLGTGWGLAPQALSEASLRLEPIVSPRPDGYNHLSVRAAAAIFLDRLLATKP